MSRDECAGNAAAYVLGALDVGEAAAYQRHLQRCTLCTEEVAGLRRVTEALAMAAPPRPVPDHLRRRVLGAARGDSGPAEFGSARRAASRD